MLRDIQEQAKLGLEDDSDNDFESDEETKAICAMFGVEPTISVSYDDADDRNGDVCDGASIDSIEDDDNDSIVETFPRVLDETNTGVNTDLDKIKNTNRDKINSITDTKVEVLRLRGGGRTKLTSRKQTPKPWPKGKRRPFLVIICARKASPTPPDQVFSDQATSSDYTSSEEESVDKSEIDLSDSSPEDNESIDDGCRKKKQKSDIVACNDGDKKNAANNVPAVVDLTADDDASDVIDLTDDISRQVVDLGCDGDLSNVRDPTVSQQLFDAVRPTPRNVDDIHREPVTGFQFSAKEREEILHHFPGGWV